MSNSKIAFPAGYQVRALSELPGGRALEHEFYREGGEVHGGVLFEVTTQAGRWDGIVSDAPASVSAALSGIYTTPLPTVVCVVAAGDACFIDVQEPADYWFLDDFPVMGVRGAVSEGILVLGTPWRVIGIGRDGVAWRTPRIAVDGIALGELSDGKVTGVADPDMAPRDFLVDLRTGRHEGGARLSQEI